MKTIKQLENEGFTGPDVNLTTSLQEYGIAWKPENDKGEFQFYFGVEIDSDFNYIGFDWGCLTPSEYIDESWISLSDVASALGIERCELEQRLKENDPYALQELISYYGAGNFGGDGYSGTFKIDFDGVTGYLEKFESCGLNADWSVEAWRISGNSNVGIVLVDTESDCEDFELVAFYHDNDCEKQSVTLAKFNTAECIEFLEGQVKK